MDVTTCPECGACAEVQWREVFESTDGPIEHVKILCVQRHWFVMPTAGLAGAQVSASSTTAPDHDRLLGQPGPQHRQSVRSLFGQPVRSPRR